MKKEIIRIFLESRRGATPRDGVSLRGWIEAAERESGLTLTKGERAALVAQFAESKIKPGKGLKSAGTSEPLPEEND